MKTPLQRTGLLAAVLVTVAWPRPVSAQATATRPAVAEMSAVRSIPADATEQVDQIFARWDSNASPGCAVGVTKDGAPVLERAYGMADLEHAVPNTPATIFEGGSLSKQFTAAAVVLLVLDGRLSLDDDVRDYIPELPDYGHTITLHHLMTHTSGLRDWGSVAAISGWDREERSHDHDDVLDILSRQSALNFVPGHEYSYSNSGYNLLAMVVTRVSGMPFAEFSRERIFEPLGLHHTQWRDDYRRIVPGRSSAYNRTDDGWEINRPIEYVHGNGGILTTVGDLGIWDQALVDGKLGGPPRGAETDESADPVASHANEFVRLMHKVGRLNDGSLITYAGGLMVAPFMGVPAVTHTGSTAGYRAFLGRYPGTGISVAMLCNASDVSTGGNGGRVARVFLGDLAVEPTPNEAWATSADAPPVQAFAGLYADPVTGFTMELTVESGALALNGSPLTRTGPNRFAPGTGDRRFRFVLARADVYTAADLWTEDDMWFEVDDWQYSAQKYERVEPWAPSRVELSSFVGTYVSADAETTFGVRIGRDGQLIVSRRPADTWTLSPVYEDTFRGAGMTYRFHRDASQRVVGMSLSLGRVYDMGFTKTVR